MAAKNISKMLVWILLGLLILGLGGFGVTNLSGTLRKVGSVGDEEIRADEYFRALNREIRAAEAERREAISFLRAREMGIVDRVQSQLVTQAAIDHETAQFNLSIGDRNLRDQIVEIRQFQGLDGEFDREAYTFALEQSGLSEAEFEQQIRDEAARGFLQAAVLGGVEAADAYTDILIEYLGERRDVSWAELDRNDLETGLPVPDEEDLVAYHAANEEDFTRPEVKRITYAWLTPEMIIDSVQVDEEALRDAYEAREEEFNQPERRLVERLVFPDKDAADAALSRLESGEATFEQLVEERGLELSDIDLGDVARPDLDGAAEAVFDAAVGDVVGPLQSPLGPALFRVNAILSEQVTSFEEAEPQLRDELAADRARRVIEAKIDEIDDLLAGGATVEDLAKETDMELGRIDWHPGMTEGIGAYEAFRAAAQDLSREDYPEIAELEDSGIFTMRLDEVLPPALQPLDAVRQEVRDGWTMQAATEALKQQVEPQLSALEDGESFESAGLEIQGAQALTRRSFQADAPDGFISAVFGMEAGETKLIEGEGRIWIVRLDEIMPPDRDDQELQQLRQVLAERASNGIAQDMFRILANDIRTRAGIDMDQQALNAVHANFQ